MSTFDGIVKEFPTIRIDYFRTHPDKPPPAALFLSHVHSDHLLGLESVKMPFIYCSSTTRQLLLQMEKYPHRINFARGILERRRQAYRHLKGILRPLPMQTPTEIELSPKSRIRVTLFDANHCPGAVMFLMEGDNKAIVYTGDIRAEPWWVNSIVQNPVVLPYTCGMRVLDCLYLDTTFATHDEPYREFPTKAEGLRELMQQVSKYPSDTHFYFRSWTLGYENVWILLSNFLKSPIHVDNYQLRLLGDGESHRREGFDLGPSLAGFTLGNSWHPGCLTKDTDPTVRIHSCEPGTSCHAKLQTQENVVWITPIIARLRDGTELGELGAGGGWGDLYPTQGFTFDNFETLQYFGTVFAEIARNEIGNKFIQEKIEECQKSRGSKLSLKGLETLFLADEEEDLAIEEFRETLKTAISKMQSDTQPLTQPTFHFPYSRHSSYNELCHLVGEFRPKDICPCTVDPESWTEDVSMESLFGNICSKKVFYYDKIARNQVKRSGVVRNLGGDRKRKREQNDSQETESQQSAEAEEVYQSARGEPSVSPTRIDRQQPHDQQDEESSSNLKLDFRERRSPLSFLGGEANPIFFEDDSEDEMMAVSAFVDHAGFEDDLSKSSKKDTLASLKQSNNRPGRHEIEEAEERRRLARMEAYAAAQRCLDQNDSNDWDWYPLRSIGRKGHEEEEDEL